MRSNIIIFFGSRLSSLQFFDFNSLSSPQLLVWPSTSCLLFNFFFMVLIWGNFYAIVLEGEKILRKNFG
jgi:hypothetical protein